MSSRTIFILSFVAAMLVLGIFVHHFYSFTVDDAYISFRYASNLAAGDGLVFNVGERVEGYTNFLWTLLLGLLIRFGGDPEVASKVLGILFAFATLLLVLDTSRKLLPDRPWFSSIAALLLVTSPSFAIYAVSGLETAMFACLLVLAIRLFLREESSPKCFQWSWLVLFLLTLTRPEGLLFFGLFAAAKFLPERNVRRLAVWALPYLVLLIAYLAWKYVYFGNLLPNTFYAKTGRGLYQFMGGLFYTYSYFKSYGGIITLILVLLPLAAWPHHSSTRKKAVGLLLVSFATWVAYSVYKGHDPLPSFRFFVLVLPVTLLLMTHGLAILHQALGKLNKGNGWSTWAAPVMTALIVGLLMFQNLVVTYLSTASKPQMREYQIQIMGMDARHEFIPMGRALKKIAPPESRIAVIDAGAIPYYSGLYTIDRWGLIDPHIARRQGGGKVGEKFDAPYVLSKRPEFIQTKMYRSGYKRLKQRTTVHLDDFDWPGDMYLFLDSGFTADYQMCEEPVLDAFFIRKDIVPSTTDVDTVLTEEP